MTAERPAAAAGGGPAGGSPLAAAGPAAGAGAPLEAVAPGSGVSMDPLAATCAAPIPEVERVILGHGSGGRLSANLMRDVIGPALGAASPGR
jgi:hypothetical protein